MKDLGILETLPEGQLDMVKHAVTQWVDAGEPGIFGFVSERQLDEIGVKAIKGYKLKMATTATFVVLPVCVITAVGILGYKKFKNRNNETDK